MLSLASKGGSSASSDSDYEPAFLLLTREFWKKGRKWHLHLKWPTRFDSMAIECIKYNLFGMYMGLSGLDSMWMYFATLLHIENKSYVHSPGIGRWDFHEYCY